MRRRFLEAVRRYLPLVILTGTVFALVTATVRSRSWDDPILGTSLNIGSLTCITTISADGDWYLSVSQAITSPSGVPVLPNCYKETISPPLLAFHHIEWGGNYYRPGTWTCHVGATGSGPGGAPWSDQQMATAFVTNPTCDCTPGGTNHAVRLMPTIGFYVDIGDPENAFKVDTWFQSASNWWNPRLASAGSSKRIEYGSFPIRVEDLPFDQKAKFTNEGGGGFRILLDPDFLLYGDAFAMTLMAHELGHALGVMGHSSCDEYGSLMAEVVNNPHGDLSDAERCFVHSDYASFSPTCTSY